MLLRDAEPCLPSYSGTYMTRTRGNVAIPCGNVRAADAKDEWGAGMQLEALQSLALSVAAARSPDLVLSEMVRGLSMTEGIALARVWLLRSDPGEPPHLELRASVGASIVDPEVRWTSTDGAHGRIPLSFGKVGRVAATNTPLLLQKGPRDWLVEPEWATAEGIRELRRAAPCLSRAGARRRGGLQSP